MYAIIATTAFLASTALASSVGNAIVINKCEYDVKLCNVPNPDGGYDEVDKTMSPGDTYTQQWTELSNGAGWSIKLSNDSTLDNILQYEYTYQGDGTIWYDLSEVNGNPWDGNWEITATSDGDTCSPKQQAYRYATDDAYGMQACAADATITVTLCSGEEQNDGEAASASSSVAAATSTAASTWSNPTLATPTLESNTVTSDAAPQTTFATSVSSSAVVTTNPAGVTVTDVATAIVTELATVTHWWHHPHGRRQHEHN